MSDEILYQDPSITLTNTYITINKYYFPLATSKTIMFTDIENVEINDIQGATHRWGLSTKYLNNWFCLDNKRSTKKQFIAIKMKNRNIKPSFTPQDAQKVFQLIWEGHTVQGRQQVQRRTNNVGKQTQVAQQQILERMKQQSQVQQTTMNNLNNKQ